MRVIIFVVAVVFASGCASVRDKFSSMSAQSNPDSSYVVRDISVSDSEFISKDITSFLAAQMPAAKTTLGMNSSSSAFDSMLKGGLAQSGFGVSESSAAESVPVRYIVTPFQTGFLLRLRYGGKEVSRLYRRTESGALFSNVRFAVREVSK